MIRHQAAFPPRKISLEYLLLTVQAHGLEVAPLHILEVAVYVEHSKLI